jgi:hypothetical protein
MPHRVAHSEAQPAEQRQRREKAENRARAERQLAIAPRLFSLWLFPILVEISAHEKLAACGGQLNKLPSASNDQEGRLPVTGYSLQATVYKLLGL